MILESNYNRNSLFSSVMTGAKTGAAIGKCMTGIVGTATGGLAGAAVGCLCGLVMKPLANLHLLDKVISFVENK